MSNTQLTEAINVPDSSRGIVEFAEMLKQYQNRPPSEPVFGIIISCLPVRIQLDNKKIILEQRNIKSIVDLDKRIDGYYVNLEKRVAMLEFNKTYTNSGSDYLVLGVIV